MTNRHEKLRAGLVIATVISIITAIVLSAPATERDADATDATKIVRVHEHRTLPVASLGPLTVHVWRRGTEVQVVALDEVGSMVVFRAGTLHDGTLSVAAPMPGNAPARIRSIDPDGTMRVEECAHESCVQSIARHASALAARTNFIPYAGSTSRSLAVRMCPADGAEIVSRTSIPHWVQAGADAPCKWQIVPAATLAAWPVTGSTNRVRVDDSVFQIHRAPIRLIHRG